jgi:hypothetical protein
MERGGAAAYGPATPERPTAVAAVPQKKLLQPLEHTPLAPGTSGVKSPLDVPPTPPPVVRKGAARSPGDGGGGGTNGGDGTERCCCFGRTRVGRFCMPVCCAADTWCKPVEQHSDAELLKVFKYFDKNEDEVIDRNELKAVLDELMRTGQARRATEKEVDSMMEKADTDGNGRCRPVLACVLCYPHKGIGGTRRCAVGAPELTAGSHARELRPCAAAAAASQATSTFRSF